MIRCTSAHRVQGSEGSNSQYSGSLTPGGASTSRTSTTLTGKSGCSPPGRHGPFNHTAVALLTATIAVRAGSPPRASAPPPSSGPKPELAPPCFSNLLSHRPAPDPDTLE